MSASASVPKFYRKLVGVTLSQRFREAVQIQKVATPIPGPGELLVQCKYAGVNASDINWTAGRYVPGIKPPFDTGFEGMGNVAVVGENCGDFKPGDAVCYMQYGAFGEYLIIPAKRALPIPRADPQYIPFMVSGLTASISLDRFGELKSGDNVLITAAAGGTGQFAVQLAKLAGCHIIGTCSSEEKVEFLKSLGCDRPINYKQEDLKSVLKTEYPRGVDVVYESVGGEMFNTCVKNLAIGGRLILIGFISNYQDSSFVARPSLPLYNILLSKSASIRGFFLNNHIRDQPSHFSKLVSLYTVGKLQSIVDFGNQRGAHGRLKGVESIADAIDYLYTGKSVGKVVVELGRETDSKL